MHDLSSKFLLSCLDSCLDSCLGSCLDSFLGSRIVRIFPRTLCYFSLSDLPRLVAGSLEGMIRGLSGTVIDIDIAENGSGFGREDDGQLQGQVKDLEHGVKQGGKV